MSIHLYFFRHGQTDWNLEGRIQGKNDVPLNDTGRAQAHRLVRPLSRVKIQALISSDLSRARETAEIVAGQMQVQCEIKLDSRLREAGFGKVEGMTRQEVMALLGEEKGQQIRDVPMGIAMAQHLGAEQAQHVTSRVWDAVREYLSENPHRKILGVSTHGGVIRRMLHELLGDEKFPPPISNGAVYGMRVVDSDWKKIEVLTHLPWEKH